MKIKRILTLAGMAVFWFAASPVWAEEVAYIVMSSDTLEDISSQYHVDIDIIRSLNDLTGDSLQVGQKLVIIPDPDSATSQMETPPPAPAEYYTVQAEDNLWAIAMSYNTTVDMLKELNQLDSDALFIGQQLIVVPTGGANHDGEQVSRGGERSPSATADLLAYAASYLGTPYAYGGSGPGGFDCSGFTAYVFKHFGYSLSRSASGQYANGTPVSKEELQPGDLVFFKCRSSVIDHVGIYAGDGTFIHSSSPRSGGVIYTAMSESYYLYSYSGAIRVL